MSRKCIRNAIIMLKYRNSYAIAVNSFGNSKFVIKFAHNKNLKYKFRICQVYKFEAPVDNKDLCVMQIPNMPRKFVVPTYLLSKSKFGNELVVVRKLNRIFKHYECIANAFVRPSNLAPSAVRVIICYF